MPAIITHHLFGEDASRRLPANLTFVEEELLAFLLGNQGTDPFYFCLAATPSATKACRAFASSSHRGKELEALTAARRAVDCLPSDDQAIGRAFVLGLLAHYLLDSEAHAFIKVQENAICEAGEDLEDAHGQVHALIESELDTWMLWSARKLTIAEAPAWSYLARTEHISRVGGALLSQVAWQVFDTRIDPDLYESCLKSYELMYKVIDPLGNPAARIMAQAEQLAMRYSYLSALAHSDSPTDSCAAANLDCHPWLDPLTLTEQTTSFPDVFYNALEMWPALAEVFAANEQGKLDKLMARSYYGGPREG